MKRVIAVLMMLSLASAANAAVYNTTYKAISNCYCDLLSVFTKKGTCEVSTDDENVLAMCEAGFRNDGYELVDSNKATLKNAAYFLGGSVFTLILRYLL
jgi:hypothetical protein